MANVGDILRWTQCGNVFGETACNVFYYIVSVWTGNADIVDLVNALKEVVTDVMIDGLSEDYVIETSLLENLDSISELAELEIGEAGAGAVDAIAPFVAASFQLTRTNNTTRHGYKRVAGIAENQVADGVITPASTFLQDIADAFAGSPAVLDSGTMAVEIQIDPVIIGRLPSGALDFARINPVAEVTYPKLTTQNTRKPGVGS